MNHLNTDKNSITRRSFIRNGSLLLVGAGFGQATELLAANETKPVLRFGLVTDLHYADKAPAGSRHYRESLPKLAEAAKRYATERPNFVVELGDFIDAAVSVDREKSYLKRVLKDFVQIPGKKHFVLGNHCVHTLNKAEFLDGVSQRKSYYSFDAGGYHFVILDSCFRSDGVAYGRKNFQWTDPNIPAAELDWLRADLKKTTNKTIVFAHQRLDVGRPYGVKNAPDVRKLLEASKKVLAVFQGHSHKNDHKSIGGIHYCTFVAMVEGSGAENSGYSTIDILPNDVVKISGHRKQDDYMWT